MVEADIIEKRLRDALGDISSIRVEDLTGTKDHYRVDIVSRAFRGMSRIERHQLVYKALGELMAGPIHALTLTTKTPDEHETQG